MTTGRKALVLGIVAAWVLAAPVMAAEPIEFSVAAQPLGTALTEIARTAGLEVMFPADAVAGRRAPAINGRRTLADVFDQLLAGTGLTATIENGTIVVREDGEIVVTGTRIRGAAIASPLISISGVDMRAAGHTTLTDVAAALPQNFGGGQTPGLGFLVPQSSGENIGSGTALNLRGLGQDATLTLLNGRRLSFGGNRQAIDISAIPLAAVERLEIVADGASALYGSDAVAGVANVILKRDYDGVTTSARFGASTDGGNAQQQYGLVAGTRWTTGGVIATYDYGHQSAVLWRQRAYTAETNDGLTLYPKLEHHSLVASGHQALGSDITLGLDALYNWRRDRRTYAVSESPAVPRYAVPGHVESLTIAPSLTVAAGRWSLAAAATYGFDRTHYGTDMIAAGAHAAGVFLQRGVVGGGQCRRAAVPPACRRRAPRARRRVPGQRLPCVSHGRAGAGRRRVAGRLLRVRGIQPAAGRAGAGPRPRPSADAERRRPLRKLSGNRLGCDAAVRDCLRAHAGP